jgi:hypothetical protein
MKTVSTKWGNYDSATIADVRKTLEQAEADGMDRDQVVKWRGRDLLISFGWYLVEYVEMELAKNNTGGL